MSFDIHKNTKAFIFDIDGTLADSMHVHFEAWQDVAEKYSFDISKALFYELAGVPTSRIAVILNERFGYSLDPETVARQKEEAFVNRIDEIKPNESVVALVHKYYGTMPMSLGTGGSRRVSELTIRSIGLDKYFDILVASEDVENHKPAPDTFLLCAERMKVKPKFCQVFEDGDQGLEAVYRAGMIATDVRPIVQHHNKHR